LPSTVAEAHASTWITNRADGMIYHQALTQAAAQLDLKVFYFEKDEVSGEKATSSPVQVRSSRTYPDDSSPAAC